MPGLPSAHYHAHPGIGASTARLAHKSIRLYKDAVDGLIPSPDRGCLKIGTLVHMAVLEPDRFAAQVVTEGPINTKTGKPYGRDTNAFADWEAENPGKIVVEPFIKTMITRCPDEIRHRLAHGESEESWFAESGGLSMKARPDKLLGSVITDLKTCQDVDDARRDLFRHGYWFSDAWYRMVGKLVTGEVFSYDFVFAEKKAPFRWRIVSLSPQYSAWADKVVDDTIGKILLAMRTGIWDDDAPLHQEAAIPEFLISDDVTADADGSINLGDDE